MTDKVLLVDSLKIYFTLKRNLKCHLKTCYNLYRGKKNFAEQPPEMASNMSDLETQEMLPDLASNDNTKEKKIR